MKKFNKSSITADLSKKMIEAAERKAEEIGFGISVTIVDESGVLKAFSRMDNALPISIDTSRKKAVTAVGMGMATGNDWYEFIKDDPILNEGAKQIKDFMLLGGGHAIIIEGEIIGAIGISGGHYKQDEECVKAALSILNN